MQWQRLDWVIFLVQGSAVPVSPISVPCLLHIRNWQTFPEWLLAREHHQSFEGYFSLVFCSSYSPFGPIGGNAITVSWGGMVM